MSRRTAGQGQIRLRADGRLEVRVFAEGRRRTRALPKGSSRQMAERVREELLREGREGRLAGTSSETLAAYLQHWLSTTGTRTLRPKSLERYTGVIERPPVRQLPPRHAVAGKLPVLSSGIGAAAEPGK